MNLGRLIVVGNRTTGLNRASRSRTARYNQVTYLSPTGSIEQLLLTDRELDVTSERAKKNAKTLYKISWLDRCMAFKIRLITRLSSLFNR